MINHSRNLVLSSAASLRPSWQHSRSLTSIEVIRRYREEEQIISSDMADDKMPDVKNGDQGRKLTLLEKEFMQFVEKKNQARVANLQRMRRNNRITGLMLGAGVLGIYGYTMYAVHQESFLDDFDEPEKTSD